MKELERFRQFLNEEVKVEDTVANKLTPAIEKLTPVANRSIKKRACCFRSYT